MVDSAKPLGQELEGGLPPAEAASVEVPVGGVPQEAAPATVPVEAAPDLGPSREAVGAAATGGEEVMPAAEPAPIEVNPSGTPPKEVSEMIGGDQHENLENSLVGDRGPNSGEAAKKEVLPGEESAITAEEPAPVQPSVDGVTELKPTYAVPAPPPEAPKIPVEEGVTPLEPEYAEPLPTAAPESPTPAAEGAPTPEASKLNAELDELADKMNELGARIDALKSQAKEYQQLLEEFREVSAQHTEKWKQIKGLQESNLSSQVG